MAHGAGYPSHQRGKNPTFIVSLESQFIGAKLRLLSPRNSEITRLPCQEFANPPIRQSLLSLSRGLDRNTAQEYFSTTGKVKGRRCLTRVPKENRLLTTAWIMLEWCYTTHDKVGGQVRVSEDCRSRERVRPGTHGYVSRVFFATTLKSPLASETQSGSEVKLQLTFGS